MRILGEGVTKKSKRDAVSRALVCSEVVRGDGARDGRRLKASVRRIYGGTDFSIILIPPSISVNFFTRKKSLLTGKVANEKLLALKRCRFVTLVSKARFEERELTRWIFNEKIIL